MPVCQFFNLQSNQYSIKCFNAWETACIFWLSASSITVILPFHFCKNNSAMIVMMTVHTNLPVVSLMIPWVFRWRYREKRRYSNWNCRLKCQVMEVPSKLELIRVVHFNFEINFITSLVFQKNAVRPTCAREGMQWRGYGGKKRKKSCGVKICILRL